MKTEVLIVGAGPSGLATAACLNLHSIPNLILEKEDCIASLWKRRAYDRLKLHLAKEFCHLPHMSFPANTPTFVPKDDFIRYIDAYADRFSVTPTYSTAVESAYYDRASEEWRVVARSALTGEASEYTARFLVAATGENGEGSVPDIPGLQSFTGEVLHSCNYKSAVAYQGKSVLVVGSGNSGMEIAYDLASHGAKTTIAIRSAMHVMTKEMIHLGMILVKYLPVRVVDLLIVALAKLKYGNLSAHGIDRPSKGPLYLKATTGRSAVIDVGTVEKIQKGDIQVVKRISEIVRGNEVIFTDGKSSCFDAIVFATGYRSTVGTWLKDGEYSNLFSEEGFPKQRYPNHWKLGNNGMYCAGFARRGLAGVSEDAQEIANDIKMIILEAPPVKYC